MPQLFPGVRKVLEYYARKKMAVVSNKSRQIMVREVDRLEVNRFFEVFIGGEAGCLKPSACQLIKVLGEFSVEPIEALMVGDMTFDIISGKNAGMLTAAAAYGIGKVEDLLKVKPDYFLNDITELMEKIPR